MTIETITIVSGGRDINIPTRVSGGKHYPLVEAHSQVGYGLNSSARMTPVHTFTIADGADGSLVTPVDLYGNYESLLVTCESCIRIQVATNLSAVVGFTGDDTLCDLYAKDDPSTVWSVGALPTTGSLAFGMTYPFGIRRIRFVLSNAASGGSVVFQVRGLGTVFNMYTYGGLGDLWQNIDIHWEDFR